MLHPKVTESLENIYGPVEAEFHICAVPAGAPVNLQSAVSIS